MKNQNEDLKLKLVPFIMNRGVKSTSKTPYGVNMIQAKSMWNESNRGEGINIAVIDSGCDIEHESLKDNIVAVRNFTDEDKKNPNIVIDRVGHGTHVAGTIAANGNNNTIVGVAPWANLYILKAIVESFNIIELGKVSVGMDIYVVLLKFLVEYFIIAFRIILPIFTAMLITNTVLGILAKAAPQMNMFVVGMQLKVVVGLAVLFFTAATIGNVTNFIFEEMKVMMKSAIIYLK